MGQGQGALPRGRLQEGHRPASGHEPQHGSAPAGERRAAALRARARWFAARSVQGRRARDAPRGRERAGHGDPRAPAARGLRRRHHDLEGLPGERAPAVQGHARLRAHRLRPRRDPAGRLVGYGRRRAGGQGRAQARPRPRHDAALLGCPRRRLHALRDHGRRCAGPLRLPRAPWRRPGTAGRRQRRQPRRAPRPRASASRGRARRPARQPRHGLRGAAAEASAEQGIRGAHQRLPRDLVLAAARVCGSRRPTGAERRLDDRGRLGAPPPAPRGPRA